MSNNGKIMPWHGIPRDQIDWQPTVVADRMVGCTTCATICTRDAIEFPATGYIRQLIRDEKLLRQSKDMLRANREKYDVAQREPAAD
ncbi:MAG: hypothetical protein ACE5FD_04830 [Anaerolineae bacterium]